MMNLADSFIDADFNMRAGTNFNSNSYTSTENFDKDSVGNRTKKSTSKK